MLRPFVFMAALALGIVSPVKPPNVLPALDHELRRFSEASLAFIAKTLTPAKAQTEPVDPVAAANLDEDLDFRVAEQTMSEAGWRAFLTAHPSGTHASTAQAELDKLTGPLSGHDQTNAHSNGAENVVVGQMPTMANGPSPAPEFAPVVEIANAPPRQPDFFAALERPPPPETRIVETTVVKWRERRTRIVTHWVHERPRYYRRRPPPPPFFLSWFTPDPRAWRGH